MPVSYDERELGLLLLLVRELGAEVVGIDAADPPLDPVDAALSYARRGWPVFPLHTATPACSCRHECDSPGKHPRVTRGLHAAVVDPAQITTWWQMWPQANIGIATGVSSGLVVLDIDPRNGGDASLALLESIVGPLPGTPVATTGGGGAHLYYERHPGWPTPSRTNAFPALPGIDIKADGGYVVAPPSVHASGARYAWAGLAGQPAPWPLTLMWRHAPPRAGRAGPGQPGGRAGGTGPGGPVGASARNTGGPSTTRGALKGACRALANSGEGNRNNTLNWAAWVLAPRVADGDLDRTEAERELTIAALNAGLRAFEVAATIGSAFTAAGL